MKKIFLDVACISEFINEYNENEVFRSQVLYLYNNEPLSLQFSDLYAIEEILGTGDKNIFKRLITMVRNLNTFRIQKSSKPLKNGYFFVKFLFLYCVHYS